MIFWQTARVVRTARPGVRVPTGSGVDLTVIVDDQEKYPYRFVGRRVITERRRLVAGDYAIESEGRVIATVERKTLPDFVSSETRRLAEDWTCRFVTAALTEIGGYQLTGRRVGQLLPAPALGTLPRPRGRSASGPARPDSRWRTAEHCAPTSSMPTGRCTTLRRRRVTNPRSNTANDPCYSRRRYTTYVNSGSMVAKNRGLELLNRLTREGRTAVTSAEIQTMLSLSPQATSNLLSRLVRSGLVERVAAGRYAIRQLGSLGTSAAWDDLGSAVAALFGAHPHRIGFLSALDHHGLLVRPVRSVQVASPFRPRERALASRPLRVVRESIATVMVGTEPFGPSRIATVERALVDTASRPQLTGGAMRLAEALAAANPTTALRDLSLQIDAGAAYRRIASIASTLSLPVRNGLEPIPWRTLVELDRRARGGRGWVDTTWGVAWPYPPAELEAVIRT